MLPHTHFLFALVLSLIGVKYGLFGSEFILVPILAVLIDIDHLISYNKKHKSWSIKNCWNTALTKHEHLWTFIHHWDGILVITLILIIVAWFNFPIASIFGIAYFSHMLLDKFHVWKEKRKKHKFLHLFGFVMPLVYSEIILDIILLVSLFLIISFL